MAHVVAPHSKVKGGESLIVADHSTRMSPRKNILYFYFINFLQHDDNRQGGRPRLQFSGFVIRNESRSDVSCFFFFVFF